MSRHTLIKILLSLFALLAVLSWAQMRGPLSPQKETEAVRVYPGATGFGTQTPAGRGGKILKVTNLKNDGEGSLRKALEEKGPRIVVFEVGGTLKLPSDLVIRNPFITVAGQTAPPPGITLRGAGMTVKTHDVLIQHLRIRVGDEKNGPNPTERDGIQIHAPSYNVVIDHISSSWAVDENASTWGGVNDITFSNSIFSEGLRNSIHPKGPHSMGILIGDHSKRISVIGNLLSHNEGRNPLVKGDVSMVMFNNLIYNCGSSSCVGVVDDYSSGPSFLSIAGNVFLEGKNTLPGKVAVKVYDSSAEGTEIFVNKNITEGAIFDSETKFDPRVKIPPLWHELPKTDGKETKEWVLSNVGAYPSARDMVDQRIVEEVKSKTGEIIDSQEQVGGWPVSETSHRVFEIPQNPHSDDDKDGYTNIEERLYQLTLQMNQKKTELN